LGELTAVLHGWRVPQLNFKKGALCRMNVDTLRAAQCATMEWLLPPGVIDEG
jgi:hypothetical protein